MMIMETLYDITCDANMTRNIKIGSTQMTRYYRFNGQRDQAHQIVMQIRSTRSAVESYNDVCIILQKYTRTRKSERWEMKAEEQQIAVDRNYSGLKECSVHRRNNLYL